MKPERPRFYGVAVTPEPYPGHKQPTFASSQMVRPRHHLVHSSASGGELHFRDKRPKRNQHQSYSELH